MLHISIKNSGFSRATSIHFGHNLSLVSGGVTPNYWRRPRSFPYHEALNEVS